MENLHAVVPSSLSVLAGANVPQTDGALAHPLSPHLTVRLGRRGERQLLIPPPSTPGKHLGFILQ